ncbi:GmrSD restriction endonuclease domain-containing protein [Sporosarcina jiandibaonis]|uniref:GmrSD restriction endonuclease domain-containing protein n=1 Tax=Sporosarcina jiandibaonis TaxID=2715535 RepID=UPI0015537799|nr:DUF262 domain-containing protein [Sporosarcina jiandibaonis]
MKYKIDKFAFKELENKVMLPSFQRALVWSDNEKKQFIRTLHKGYPFGSILIYKYEDIGKYSLIDGLQRYTTILDFRDDPSKYMDVDHFIQQIVNSIQTDIKINEAQKREYRGIIKEIIKEIIEKHNKNEELCNYYLNDRIKEKIPVFPRELERYAVNIQTDIINFSRNYLDINEIVIPCIEFIGDQSELAEVFENLNRGGKKLSKYQVFAAQWSNSEIYLDNGENGSNILNKVIERYIKLNDSRQIEIKDFDEYSMRKERKINLSELCYALGVLIIEELDVFFGKNDIEKEDLANEIGYSTMGILMNIPNNKLHKVIDKAEFFKDPAIVEEIVEKTLDVYQTINTYFNKYLLLPGNERKYESKVKTNFQLMSYFAALWVTRYDVDFDSKAIKTISNYRSSYNLITKNFIKYYVLDIVNRTWRGSGDSLLNDIYINKNIRYSVPLDKEKLTNNLLEWHDEVVNKSSIRLEDVSKALLTIHNSFSLNYFAADSYDYEHIIARRRLSPIYKSEEIPGGSLGNIMFMDKRLNRSKKDDNLYSQVKEGHILDVEYLRKVDYPSERELSIIENDLNSDKGESAKKFIKRRGRDILNSLINNLY